MRGRWEFYDELGSDRQVSFGADGALVFLNDLGGDGQTEAGAALLGVTTPNVKNRTLSREGTSGVLNWRVLRRQPRF